MFGYLGPNGAGKTTTVRLLLDFLRPTRGRSVVLGGSGGDPAIRRRIGTSAWIPRTAPPTSGLDLLLQHELNALVREMAAGGATVLLFSHVLPEVDALAARVGITRRGRLVAVAGVDELRQAARQRLDLHVAGAVGDADLTHFRNVPEVMRPPSRPRWCTRRGGVGRLPGSRLRPPSKFSGS